MYKQGFFIFLLFLSSITIQAGDYWFPSIKMDLMVGLNEPSYIDTDDEDSEEDYSLSFNMGASSIIYDLGDYSSSFGSVVRGFTLNASFNSWDEINLLNDNIYMDSSLNLGLGYQFLFTGNNNMYALVLLDFNMGPSWITLSKKDSSLTKIDTVNGYYTEITISAASIYTIKIMNFNYSIPHSSISYNKTTYYFGLTVGLDLRQG